MNNVTKILVAGVGGQGVVFLTNLIVDAAMLAKIPVATSEIHGLSQRGGSVTAGITLGENSTGFIEKAGVDILIGLEPLEAQRCVSFLHKGSTAIIDENRILPYSVNSGHAQYPETEKFIEFLQKNIKTVIHNTEELAGVKSILRNLYTLGKLCSNTDFPIPTDFIIEGIKKVARSGFEESSINAFKKGLETHKIDMLKK